MAVAAVSGLAGDAEGVADLGPARTPVQGSGDGIIESGLGLTAVAGGGPGGGEGVGAEPLGLSMRCKRMLTRRCPPAGPAGIV